MSKQILNMNNDRLLWNMNETSYGREYVADGHNYSTYAIREECGMFTALYYSDDDDCIELGSFYELGEAEDRCSEHFTDIDGWVD